MAAGCAHPSAASPAAGYGPGPARQEAREAIPELDSRPALTLEKTSAAPRAALAQAEGDGGAPAARAAQAVRPLSPTANDEKLVISGGVVLRTGNVETVARDVRGHAGEVGGSVVGDEVTVTPDGERAVLRLRLPPAQAVPFADWLASRAAVESRTLEAADVSRQFFDQAVAIKNLQITIRRLQDLAGRPNADLKDVLTVERELTRVRGELEAMEGEQRLVEDRVARATLAVTILPTRFSRPTPPVAAEPELKFELLPHANVLRFFDDRPGRSQTRGGGGVSLMFARAFTVDFTMLPKHAAEARSYLFSVSMSGYSDFLGAGRRRFLNPYLGLRVGGGSLDDSGTFLFGGEVGLELVRYKLFLLDATGRVLGLIHGEGVPNDVALEGAIGVGVPF